MTSPAEGLLARLARDEVVTHIAVNVARCLPPKTWSLDDWSAASRLTDLDDLSSLITMVEQLTGLDYGPVLDQIGQREGGDLC